MRNFGLEPRSTQLDEPSVGTKNRDKTILAVASLAVLGLALALYTLAFGFAVEDEVSGFLSFLP